MTGDTIANTFEFLLWDADARFREKRYNACVVTLGQVWESFLRLYAAATYAYHPFVSDPIFHGADGLNMLLADLSDAMRRPRKFAFDNLRNLMANSVIAQIAPTSVAEAKRDIPRIMNDRFDERPALSEIDSIASPIRRDMIRRLYAITIGDLRNRCVHQAYVPTRDQANACREEEIVFLFSMKHEFRVGDLVEVQCGAA